MLKRHTNMNTEMDMEYKQFRRELSLKYLEFQKYYSRLDSPAQIIQMVMKEKSISNNCLSSSTELEGEKLLQRPEWMSLTLSVHHV